MASSGIRENDRYISSGAQKSSGCPAHGLNGMVDAEPMKSIREQFPGTGTLRIGPEEARSTACTDTEDLHRFVKVVSWDNVPPPFNITIFVYITAAVAMFSPAPANDLPCFCQSYNVLATCSKLFNIW